MRLDYGKDGLDIKIEPEWNVTIFHPVKQESFNKPIEKIKEAINNPIGALTLNQILKTKKKVKSICIVVSDSTRPVPSYLILEPLIEELNNLGIKNKQITILIATGLHRESYEEELTHIVGKKLKSKIKVINHVATDRNSMVKVRISDQIGSILINKTYYEADLKILTGYVEPHFFFGFSGGRKSIVPGIGGAETIQKNHSADNINSPYARFGIYKENPLHKEAVEISRKVGVDFLINVCINEEHQIVDVTAGDFEKAHEKLVECQLKYIFKPIDHLYDVVICGNGGYPLDRNLYQAVKSIAIGEMAIKDGGTIISVNECIDGIGIGQDDFKDLLYSGMTPDEIHQKILDKEIIVHDQWEIQILARILMKATIYIISKLKEDELGNIGLKYAEKVEEAIEISLKKYGPNASILILPHGPQILPKYRKQNPI
ncbi:MAG: nickel-dependent lactate racemase [Candidatus Thorarchaeota archaeon]